MRVATKSLCTNICAVTYQQLLRMKDMERSYACVHEHFSTRPRELSKKDADVLQVIDV